MQIASIAFSVIIVLAGAAFNFENSSYRSAAQTKQEVLGTETQNNPYVYPNSKIISQSSTEIFLQSSDPIDTITDWYQERSQYKAFSFKGNEVHIDITKETSSNPVNIRVSY